MRIGRQIGKLLRTAALFALFAAGPLGCIEQSRRVDIPAVTSFALTVPNAWGSAEAFEREWILLDARLFWFNSSDLAGLPWTLGKDGLYYALVSSGDMAEILVKTEGRLVPSEGSRGLGLMRSRRDPVVSPVQSISPPGPNIQVELQCRGTMLGDAPGVDLSMGIVAIERTNGTIKMERGSCRAVVGRDGILMIDLTRLLGRAPKPSLVMAVAVDQFEWKDDVLTRTFPWGTTRETMINGNRIRNTWARPAPGIR